MNISNFDHMLELSETLVEAVRPTVLAGFRSGGHAENKSDSSPVTQTDRDAEIIMRKIIEREYPEHGILGEEFGITRPNSEIFWILDPIDGTKSFIAGKPTFGSLVAVVHKDRPIIGVIDIPMSGDRWVGAVDRRTTLKNVEVSTRSCKEIESAWLCATSHKMFTSNHYQKFCELEEKCANVIFGTDCMGYGLLASGWLDIVCEDTMALHDFAAHIPIIEGAGGVITDWAGLPLKINPTAYQDRYSVLAVGDRTLLAPALSALGPHS